MIEPKQASYRQIGNIPFLKFVRELVTMTQNIPSFLKYKARFSFLVFSLIFINSASAQAACHTIYGSGTHPSKVGAIGVAQLSVNSKVARSGTGRVIHRKVKCVLGRLYGRPSYSCSVKVRFCTLQGVRPRPRQFQIIR